ncbi:MAG TPA: GAF domain-containing protein, partial [Candidatus Ozemobacteraceae bacterium]|nr:GAF domain-containing protein [Candidatus Ozemobacteraceae bacterium]
MAKPAPASSMIAKPQQKQTTEAGGVGRWRSCFTSVVATANFWVPAICLAACLVIDLAAVSLKGTVWNLPRTICNAAVLTWVMGVSADVFLPLSAGLLVPGTLALAALCLWKGLAAEFLFAMFVTTLLLGIIAAINASTSSGSVPLIRFQKLEKQQQADREDRYQLLLQFSLLGCLTNIERVFDQSFQILQKYFHVQQAVIYLANYTTNELRPAKTIGYSTNSLDGLVIKVPRTFWDIDGYDPEKGLTNIIYGRAQLPTIRAILPTCSVESLMAMPLTVKGRIVGLLNVVRQ